MTRSPKLLHQILVRALEHEDALQTRKASEEELRVAREAVLDAMCEYDKTGFDAMEAGTPHDKRYARRLHGGLLSFSHAEEWHEAVSEWRYTRLCGHSPHDTVCDLCGCSHVRYWFAIENRVTGRRLKIGSQCIQNWHSPGVLTAIEFDRKRLEKEHKRELRLEELEKAAQIDPWLRARLPKLRRTVEKYGKVYDEAEDRVRAALGKPPLKGRPQAAPTPR